MLSRKFGITASELARLQEKSVEVLEWLKAEFSEKNGVQNAWKFEKAHSILHKVPNPAGTTKSDPIFCLISYLISHKISCSISKPTLDTIYLIFLSHFLYVRLSDDAGGMDGHRFRNKNPKVRQISDPISCLIFMISQPMSYTISYPICITSLCFSCRIVCVWSHHTHSGVSHLIKSTPLVILI